MIYFDNAATTFPKPLAMGKEMINCINTYCGNPGRSSHKLSLKAAQKIYECRCEIASLFHSNSPENVVFTLNTTYALNMAIKCFAKRNSHVLISNFEHNSVYRPISALSKSDIKFDIFNAYDTDDAVMKNIENKVKPNTKMIVAIHSSNVCGVLLPINKIGNFCKQNNLTFIVDAAQSAGIYDINMSKDNIDALCVPGHKSLYGPQGIGFILYSCKYNNSNIKNLSTFIEGGNGVNSLEILMPDFLPERFEAGTLSTPCIAGLCESIKLLKTVGIEEIHNHETMLYQRLLEKLKNMKNLTLYADEIVSSNTLLFNISNKSCHQIAYELDKYNICVRSGLHCTPLAHKTLSTTKDGAIRVSFGMFNKKNEVDIFCDCLNKIIS